MHRKWVLLALCTWPIWAETLEERVDRLEDRINAPQIRQNLFNPGLTAFGNFLTCIGCQKPFELREIELDIRASIDPWADGVAIIAFEPHGSHEAVHIEEGYALLKKLPGLDEAPWGLTLKMGKYLLPFGRFNQIHLHDLPQMTQPKPVQAFLGDHGFSRPGISAEFFIPTPGENNSLRLNLNILASNGLPFARIKNQTYPAGSARLAWFWDLAAEHDFEVGASAYLQGHPEFNLQPLQLYGADAYYKWRPYLQGEKRSFLIGSELFVANGVQGRNGYWPWGMFIWSQMQINQWLYPGIRYSYLQGAQVDTPSHSVGAFLTYYTTEFLRLRAGYEWDNHQQHKALLEINFIFGSHPVEPYWVNR
ncbi:MAG: hypothetical protein I8H75_03350 [Myxococcaceae bacterium]|nr:hypothetical protein [Myxococcaceae bacterium]MBH2006366.1 hypothetical protein [Myxococcaceae bacterium]